MTVANSHSLPRGWVLTGLSSVAQINPPLDRRITDDSVAVDFVPMRAVEPDGGGLIHPEVSTYGKVKKGFTAFISGDVIMAKITPCMENGKTCVVPKLPGAACFGSTEFHVVRPENNMDARWIAYFLLRHSTRHAAQRQMMGGVGQMRVPTSFLENLAIPVPPPSEQHRILEKLDELLSHLDAGVAALERAQAKLKHYRAVVLKAAVEGVLTADWRTRHPSRKLASDLITRILIERRCRWEEAQLDKFKKTEKKQTPNWKSKYQEPVLPDISKLPKLPESWCWATVDHLLAAPIINGISVRGTDDPRGIPALRLNAMSDNGFNYSIKRYLPLEPSSVDDLWIAADDFFVSRGNGSKRLVGRGTFAQPPPEKVIFPDTMMRLRFLRDSLALKWISTIWSSGLVRNQIERVAKTTAGIYKISQPDLAGISVPIPPLAEQEAIVDAVEDQFSVVDHLQIDLDAKLKNAQALRQSILRHAFAGRLVPQDPKDEPAAEFLKRIAVQRLELARRIKAAKQTNTKSLRKRTALKN